MNIFFSRVFQSGVQRVVLSGIVFFSASFDSWAHAPAGAEFRVNTSTIGDQFDPGISVDADGNFVVVWTGKSSSDSNGIYAQRYNAAGETMGSQFRINATSNGTQNDPSVAVDAAGNFVVVWTGKGSNDSNGIYARRYNAVGTALGSEFQVNGTSNGNQDDPTLAMAPDGHFVIAWSGKGSGDSNGIYARRYSAAGTALGSEFQVSTTSNGNQDDPRIALAPDGRFVIAWSGKGSGDSNGIYARRYSAAGAAQGGEFRVNTVTADAQRYPYPGMAADGHFVIAWESDCPNGIRAQLYNADGTVQGGEFQVNTSTHGDFFQTSLSMDTAGNFVVAWQSDCQDGSGYGIYAQAYDSGGAPQGDEFRVNTHVAHDQESPAVGLNSGGNLVIAWESNCQDGSGEGIYAQRYETSVSVAAPSTPDLTAASDTGISDTDDQTTATTPTFTGTAPDGTTVNLYEGTTLLGSAAVSGGVYTITSTILLPGTHLLRAQAVDADDNASPFSGELSVTIYAGRHALWKQENFGADAGNPAVAGDTADPDNDGIANLLEYAWGADPNVWSQAGIPALALEELSGRIQIQFNRITDRSDLVYRIQISDDLATWTPVAEANGADGTTTVIGGLSVVVSETGTLVKSVTVQDNTAPAGPDKRFVRVAVEKL
jgi:hypothetical protein